MALRTVVLDAPAPPPPRKTVVLRAGAPVAKGRLADILLGILGVLLLLVAIALTNVLPDKSYVDPQFRLSFVEAGAERGSQHLEFAEGGELVQDVRYDLPEGNIYSVTLASVGFLDDVSLSNPDTFRVELFDPDGNPVGTSHDVVNPRPRANGTTYGFTPVYADITFSVVPLPTEQIVAGLSHTENEEQALARLEPQHRVSNGGSWTVRVTMVMAGDCPGPDDAEPDPQQALYCRTDDPNNPDDEGAPDGEDLGNAFTIGGLRYSYYIPDVKEVK